MKFMVGCKYKYLFSLHEPCPYWRERGENNLSFTPTQCGCTFCYKSSVPERWPLKSRRQLLTIIFKDQKQCSVLHKELRVKTFPSIFKISFQNTVEKFSVCVYIYMHQSTKNCSLCTLVGSLILCQKNTFLFEWLLIHIPHLKTQKRFNIWLLDWWDYPSKFMDFIKWSS